MTLLLLPRFIAFISLFGSAIFILNSKLFVFKLLLLYGVASLVYLTLLFLRKKIIRLHLQNILIIHILFEVIISGVMVYHSGGGNSPLVLFFILSIASAAMVYQLSGALYITLSSVISYLTATYFARQDLFVNLSFFRLWENIAGNKSLFFTIMLNIVLFTIVGIICGYIAYHLKKGGALLKNTERELKKARSLTMDILESMGSGLICINDFSELLMINRTAKAILGLNMDDQGGGHLFDYFRGRLLPLAKFLHNSLSHPLHSKQFELIIHSPDGAKIPLGISVSPLSEGEHGGKGIIAVFNDLTESINMQLKLRTYDRLAAVGKLSAGIAHEIRNPLTSISGSVEILKTELELRGSNAKLMEVIIRETERLDRIIAEFLTYARIKPSKPTVIDLISIIREVIGYFHHQSEYAADIRLQEGFQQQLMIYGDREKLKQVFIRIILNAIQSSTANTPKMEIGRKVDLGKRQFIITGDFNNPIREFRRADEERVLDSGEYETVSIRDYSGGIRADRIEKIFQPFYSTRQGGSGLGLPIVQRLMESMEGVIIFETTEGDGSVFTICLKRVKTGSSPKSVFAETKGLLSVGS